MNLVIIYKLNCEKETKENVVWVRLAWKDQVCYVKQQQQQHWH